MLVIVTIIDVYKRQVYEQEAAGKTRKYYSLTRQGRGFLEKKVEEWKEYSAAVTNVLVMEV